MVKLIRFFHGQSVSHAAYLHQLRSNHTFVNQFPDCVDVRSVFLPQDYERRHAQLRKSANGWRLETLTVWSESAQTEGSNCHFAYSFADKRVNLLGFAIGTIYPHS